MTNPINDEEIKPLGLAPTPNPAEEALELLWLNYIKKQQLTNGNTPSVGDFFQTQQLRIEAAGLRLDFPEKTVCLLDPSSLLKGYTPCLRGMRLAVSADSLRFVQTYDYKKSLINKCIFQAIVKGKVKSFPDQRLFLWLIHNNYFVLTLGMNAHNNRPALEVLLGYMGYNNTLSSMRYHITLTNLVKEKLAGKGLLHTYDLVNNRILITASDSSKALAVSLITAERTIKEFENYTNKFRKANKTSALPWTAPQHWDMLKKAPCTVVNAAMKSMIDRTKNAKDFELINESYPIFVSHVEEHKEALRALITTWNSSVYSHGSSNSLNKLAYLGSRRENSTASNLTNLMLTWGLCPFVSQHKDGNIRFRKFTPQAPSIPLLPCVYYTNMPVLHEVLMNFLNVGLLTWQEYADLLPYFKTAEFRAKKKPTVLLMPLGNNFFYDPVAIEA